MEQMSLSTLPPVLCGCTEHVGDPSGAARTERESLGASASISQVSPCLSLKVQQAPLIGVFVAKPYTSWKQLSRRCEKRPGGGSVPSMDRMKVTTTPGKEKVRKEQKTQQDQECQEDEIDYSMDIKNRNFFGEYEISSIEFGKNQHTLP